MSQNRNIMKINRDYICEYLSKFVIISGCLFLYLSLLKIYISDYEFDTLIQNNTSLYYVIYQEMPNFFTIIPIFLPFVLNPIIKIMNPQTSFCYRVIWGITFSVLVIFHRIAVDIELHRVVMELVDSGLYIIVLAISLYYSKSQETYVASSEKIKKIIGSIRNKNILSVQLFKCSFVRKNDAIVRFEFKNIETMAAEISEDVNSILSIDMDLPTEDYDQFKLSISLYDEIIEQGNNNHKLKLQKSIKETKQGLIDRLNKIKLDDITKQDCCLARLLLCYSLLELKLSEPAVAALDLNDGELGINVDNEKRLFSLFRTGMLGAYLFGENRKYYFRYRRDGMKVGRKYCAFLIGTENVGDNILCLVTIKESQYQLITNDIIEWIDRLNRKLLKAY